MHGEDASVSTSVFRLDHWRKPAPAVWPVEDDQGLRQTLAVILRIAGTQVDTAPDASAAFIRLRRRQYDVAVMDMVLLPGPSGIEVIRYIRSNSPATRVFACTAYYEGDLVAETRALGVEQALHKPFDPKLLVQLIQRSAGPARGGHETPTPNSGARAPVVSRIPDRKPGLP